MKRDSPFGRGMPDLRLEYREANRFDECVHDVLATVAALERRG
jgi:hypothetical protein